MSKDQGGHDSTEIANFHTAPIPAPSPLRIHKIFRAQNSPNGCASVAVRINGEVVAKNGSRTVTPPGTQNFNLTLSHTFSGVFQQKSKSAKVEVGFPDRVVIDPTTSNPVQVLINAINSNPVVIELCDVDLTGHTLLIGDDTSIIASPRCARGPRSIGPRLYVRDNRRTDKPLLLIRGDRVVISGFRLQGPSDGIFSGDNRLEKGIHIAPFSSHVPISRIEVSNIKTHSHTRHATARSTRNPSALS